MNAPHIAIEPSILYFGTPVVLVSTLNEDGSANLAPVSSAWWLGWRCVLGLLNVSKTPQNLRRTQQCVLNLASVDEVSAVDRLARLTGTEEIPQLKQALGYRHEKAKFEAAGVTPVPSETVGAPRVLECPVQMEAVLVADHEMMSDDTTVGGIFSSFELRITRIHVHPSLLLEGHENRIDPAKWNPLIMSFQKFFGLGGGEVMPSRLAQIDELIYRMPDVDRARQEAVR